MLREVGRAARYPKQEGIVNKAWQRYLDMASGLTQVTQKRAESVVRSLVKQGEIATDRAEKAVDELLNRSEANRKAVASIVKTETDKAVGRLGLARKKEIDALERKLERLERQVGGPAAKKSSGGKKASAKKAGGKKAGSKKATAKKGAAAKRSARRTAAKKTAQRASPAKKTTPPSNPADTP